MRACVYNNKQKQKHARTRTLGALKMASDYTCNASTQAHMRIASKLVFIQCRCISTAHTSALLLTPTHPYLRLVPPLPKRIHGDMVVCWWECATTAVAFSSIPRCGWLRRDWATHVRQAAHAVLAQPLCRASASASAGWAGDLARREKRALDLFMYVVLFAPRHRWGFTRYAAFYEGGTCVLCRSPPPYIRRCISLIRAPANACAPFATAETMYDDDCNDTTRGRSHVCQHNKPQPPRISLETTPPSSQASRYVCARVCVNMCV